jgi:hypothetical protein
MSFSDDPTLLLSFSLICRCSVIISYNVTGICARA